VARVIGLTSATPEMMREATREVLENREYRVNAERF
jgi:UDP:flavonoid glycosyltransferase YjiC (YdhE family)